MARVRLSKALERAIGSGHPWIYRDAIVGQLPQTGEVVTVLDRKGRFLARGLAERGAIGVRVFTTVYQPVDRRLFEMRIDDALLLRGQLAPADTDALRLLHGEGDRLPGVVVDRYGEFAVLKLDGDAILAWRELIESCLRQRLPALGVSTLLRRSGRGEHKQVELVFGRLPDQPVEIREHGMRLLVDLLHGQKTGMFLDHRPNRWRTRELIAGLVARGEAPRVANLFGYTGGFSLAAGLGGATSVVTVDVAAPALELARQAWLRNGLDPARHHTAAVEVERWLAEQQGRRPFDLVIADPPSFASKQADRERALTAYRALHAAALPLVRDGGFYLAASCSSRIDRTAFEQTLLRAAKSAAVELQVLERGGAGFDHPAPLGFAEGEYLNVVLARVLRGG